MAFSVVNPDSFTNAKKVVKNLPNEVDPIDKEGNSNGEAAFRWY